MKLKSSLDLERFFTAVRHCQGRVTFETEEGDSLNLKSALCLFVFTAASRDHFANLSGEVVWQVAEDEALLAPFAEADG